jgi:hypothetical protein
MRLRRKRPPRTVYVGSHEDKLSRLPALKVSPDDDEATHVPAERALDRMLRLGGVERQSRFKD